MISAERLAKLKDLFAQDGITLTDAQALEIGLWLLARVKPVVRPIPLDKMELFATIRDEAKAIRQKTPFVNLYQWRQKHVSNKKTQTNRCITSTSASSKSSGTDANPLKTKTGK